MDTTSDKINQQSELHSHKKLSSHQMKQLILGILSIVLGALTIFMGVRDYEYKLLPEVLFYVFGAILILLGVYKLFEIISDRKDESR